MFCLLLALLSHPQLGHYFTSRFIEDSKTGNSLFSVCKSLRYSDGQRLAKRHFILSNDASMEEITSFLDMLLWASPTQLHSNISLETISSLDHIEAISSLEKVTGIHVIVTLSDDDYM
jgi:hypothetical protein